VKRADVKAGVLYAYRPNGGKSGPVAPCMILDTATFYANDSKSSGFGSQTKPGDPVFRRFDGYNGRDKWKASDGLGGMGSGTNPSVGFLASVPCRTGMGSSSLTHRPAEVVKTGTLDEALSLTLARRERIVKSLSANGTDTRRIDACYPERTDEQPYYDTVEPRNIVGPWEDVTTGIEEETERRAAVDAVAKAESDARVAATQARWDRITALGIAGPRHPIAESKRWTYRWEPPTYDQSMTASYRLTAEQVDALLALIPDGARAPDEEATEDDGWTLTTPPYERTSP
jgi:hypothetical protein